MRRLLILLVGLLAIMAFANAASFINAGFEGGLTGWNWAGDLQAVGQKVIPEPLPFWWAVTPYETQMGQLYGGGLPIGDIDVALGLTPGTIQGIVGPQVTATNGSAAWQDITLSGPDFVSWWWAFVATDYNPFNDSAIALAIQGGQVQAWAKLACIVNCPGAFTAPVGSYGAVGWRGLTFSGSAGDWRLAFVVMNSQDTVLSPYFFLDNGPGSLTPEPTTFALIGGGLALLAFRRRK